jgi:hypothetical protein
MVKVIQTLLAEIVRNITEKIISLKINYRFYKQNTCTVVYKTATTCKLTTQNFFF